MIKLLLTITVLTAGLNIFAGSIENLSEYRRQRKALLNKERAVIYNNDGCDAYLYPKSKLPFSIDKFLGLRTSPLKGSDVKTISYCTLSSSFGQFTHKTKAGEFLLNSHKRRGRKNVTPDFANLNTDPLKEVIKFGHANGMEVFWSNRVNDTHDYGHRPWKPYERWSKLKQAHPEYLMGKCSEHFPHGRWSAVDFTHSQIRDLAVKYLTEVCENYDVDGIELDFFRHSYLFKSVVKGGKASGNEQRMLTDMMHRIRTMTEKIGMRRGHPILVAVRVPDSMEYCKGVGIDLDKWMRDGLVDIVIGSGYFRLNHWSYLVNAAHRYGVKVYAGLSESRVKNENPDLRRREKTVYRARAAAALQAGVDGIYIFNEFGVKSPRMRYLWEIGSADKLAPKNKLYFATYRNGNPSAYLRDGVGLRNLPLVTPANPVMLSEKLLSIPIYVGKETDSAKVKLILYGRNIAPQSLDVSFNGVKLAVPELSKGLLFYTVKRELLRPGKNIVTLKLAGNYGGMHKSVLLKGDKLLSGKRQGLWRRLFSGKPSVEKIVDGSYLLGDLGRGTNIYNLIYPWQGAPNGRSILTFQAKVKASDAPDAVCLRFSNGRYCEYLRLEPGRVSLKYSGKTKDIRTDDRFHNYKVDCNRNSITVYCDGKKVLTGKFYKKYNVDGKVFKNASFQTSYMRKNSLIIGSMSGPGTGCAYWKNLDLQSFNPVLLDIALSVLNDSSENGARELSGGIQKSLLEEFPQLRTQPGKVLIAWNASKGMPEAPWQGRYYDSGNAVIEKGNLVLDHNGNGKKEYCSYEYRIDKKHKLARFLDLTFGMRLLGKNAEPQFTIITALPDDSGNATIWSFKFGRNGIWGRNGRKDMFMKYPLDSNYHDFRVIFDRKAGIAQMYIKGYKNPVITACGRKANKYPACIRFGDASGMVKGKVELKNFTIKQLDK